MRKFRRLAIILSMTVAFAFCGTGCQSQEEAVPEEDVDYEIALVTDEAMAQNGGHSEVAWNAIVEFGGANGISHKYYKAAEPTEDAFVETIKEAINSGAKIVIIDNSSMESAALKMQEEYPEIKFAMTDTDPYDENDELKIDKNTVAVSFNSIEAGYLAGYAAVIEGYTSIGFLGQSEENEIQKFGFGFVKGADRAAEETGAAVRMQYKYCENPTDRSAVKADAKSMYDKDVEVIFAAGGDIQDGFIAAADKCKGKVIGSITDQSGKSDKVITSAIYNIDKAVEDVLKAYKDNEFPGGEVLTYSAVNDGIGLALRTNGLETLTQEQYDGIMEEMAEGEIKLRMARNFKPANVKVTHVVFVIGGDETGADTETDTE